MEKLKLGLLLVVSGAIGAGFMWMFQGHSLQILPSSMSYADFVTIILAVLALLISVLGIALAIIAFWGWNELKRGVASTIERITPGHLAKQLEEGGARQILIREVSEIMTSLQAKSGSADWPDEWKEQSAQLAEVDKGPVEGEAG